MSKRLTLTNIREVWDQVRPGLEYVKDKVKAPWRPEDIYAACASETAALYLGDTGFIVVQPKTCPFTGKPELLIWVAYAKGSGNIEQFQEVIDDLAEEHGFKKLTMWTTRPGFARIAGWKELATVYERDL